MKNIKQYISIIALFLTGYAIAGQYYAPQQQKMSNYANYMRQYQGREYQIITSSNMINMDWARGAINALRYDGYTRNKDIALFLWQNIANVVNFTANLPANRNNMEEFKTRIWQSLERTVNEINPQPVVAPSAPAWTYAPSAPIQAAPTRQLPTAPAMQAVSLSLQSIMNGSLGSDYAAKAREVYAYNYDKARKGGFINLATAMAKDINEANAETSLNQTQKMTDIKKAIDRSYNALGKYRIRDKQ